MTEIGRTYNAKFPREVIEEALKVFKNRFEEDGSLNYAEWHITQGDEELALDTEYEFYSKYKKAIDSASLKYNYKLDSKPNVFSINYSKSDQHHCTTKISIKTLEDEKYTRNIFEDICNFFDKYIESNLKEDKQKYSEEITIPSCHVDKSLLKAIENKFSEILNDVNYPKYRIRIKLFEPNRREEFPNIDDYTLVYFPNDTRRISISCRDSSYQNISITFDKGKEESKIKISLIGSQARERARTIRAVINSLLDDYKIKNQIFHYKQVSFIAIYILGFVIIYFSSFPSDRITLEFLKRVAGIIAIILLIIILYRISSRLMPYTTFKTEKYDLSQERKKWLFLVLLESILVGALGYFIGIFKIFIMYFK